MTSTATAMQERGFKIFHQNSTVIKYCTGRKILALDGFEIKIAYRIQVYGVTRSCSTVHYQLYGIGVVIVIHCSGGSFFVVSERAGDAEEVGEYPVRLARSYCRTLRRIAVQ